MITSDTNQILINALPQQVWMSLTGQGMMTWQHKNGPYPPIARMDDIPNPVEPEDAIGRPVKMTSTDGREITFYITEFNPPRWLTIAGETIVAPFTAVTYMNWLIEPYQTDKTLLTMSVELDISAPFLLKLAGAILFNNNIAHVIEVTLENIAKRVDETILAANDEALL
jgi:hypothetical protein